jgi:hypothetical protein
MFRGGPVDSRGTGITSNLGYENGGRVGYDNGGAITQSARQKFRRGNLGIAGVNPFFNPRMNIGTQRRPKFIDTPLYEEFPQVSQFPLLADAGTIMTDAAVDTSSVDTGDIDLGETANVEIGLEETNINPDEFKLKETEKVKIKDDEPEVTMSDLERALGLDRARREYAEDALAAASKGFFEGKGFEAIADAAQVKSKAPDIKRLAALEEFKAKKAEKLYDKKLSAQAKLKLGTRGALQKDLDTLKDLPEGSASRKIGLKKTGFEPTLEEAIKKLQRDDPGLQKPSPSIIIGMMNLYYPTSFKGVISGDTQPKEDGTYILNDASALIIVEDGVSRLQKL